MTNERNPSHRRRPFFTATYILLPTISPARQTGFECGAKPRSRIRGRGPSLDGVWLRDFCVVCFDKECAFDFCAWRETEGMGRRDDLTAEGSRERETRARGRALVSNTGKNGPF